MHDDAELLRQYVEQRSEAAFASLVQYHLPLVYAAALRRVGNDAHLAQDVAQTVFADLARKAQSLKNYTSLAGWLYSSAQLASAAVVRRERRRKARELKAYSVETMATDQTPETDWTKIRPVLDTAMAELRDDDREAVLLRFFQQRSFAEVGTALRTSEEAARKRVDRALEKLRSVLAKHGVVSTSAVLAATLSAAIAPMPSALNATITHAALQSAATNSMSGIAAAIKLALPIAAVVTVGTWLISDQHTTNAALRAQISELTAAQQSAIALRHENATLRWQLAEIETLRREANTSPTRQSPVDEHNASEKRNPATVAVTEQGTIRWGNRHITLGAFLQELKALHAASPNDSALVIHSEGASFSAFSYVVDEARKVGIDHVVAERDGPIDPKTNLSWF
jgi:RNA polymerase sigma factor (sigma-70 family)